jgi:hypothetical protein
MDELTGAAARHGERAPAEEQAEGQAREPAAGEQALPIRRYDELTATEIVTRLPKLSKSDVGKVAAYERAHKNRKTILKDRHAEVTSSAAAAERCAAGGRAVAGQMLSPRWNEGLVRALATCPG